MSTRPRPTRTRLATGIYADRYGISVIVRGTEHRYPLGTPLEALRRDRRALFDEAGPRARTRTGTLRADVPRALETIPRGRYRETLRTLLEHWLDAPLELDGQRHRFGDVPRSAVTALHVRTQLAVFASATKADGTRRFAPKTVKELRRAFGWIYTTLDGPDAANPVRGVRTPRVVYDDPRGIDRAIIERILAEMPDRGRPQDGPPGGRRGATSRPTVNLAKVRLRVIAETGLPPAQLKRLTPRDFNARQKTLYVARRRKGAGAAGRLLPLTDAAVAALTAFAAADAWGEFSSRSVAASFARAVAKAKARCAQDGQPWTAPSNLRPYDLRHAWLTDVYRETGDIRAVSELALHANISTTLRYTQGAVSERAMKAIQAMRAALRRSA